MADLKVRIAKRCAKEFKDGEFANLGIGLPTMVADYIPEDTQLRMLPTSTLTSSTPAALM